MNKMKLTFEWSEEHERLEIHASKEGLRKLSEIANALLKGTDNHIHLMTPSWGGSGLSEVKEGTGNSIINHVAIYRWDQPSGNNQQEENGDS